MLIDTNWICTIDVIVDIVIPICYFYYITNGLFIYVLLILITSTISTTCILELGSRRFWEAKQRVNEEPLITSWQCIVSSEQSSALAKNNLAIAPTSTEIYCTFCVYCILRMSERCIADGNEYR